MSILFIPHLPQCFQIRQQEPFCPSRMRHDVPSAPCPLSIIILLLVQPSLSRVSAGAAESVKSPRGRAQKPHAALQQRLQPEQWLSFSCSRNLPLTLLPPLPALTLHYVVSACIPIPQTDCGSFFLPKREKESVQAPHNCKEIHLHWEGEHKPWQEGAKFIQLDCSWQTFQSKWNSYFTFLSMYI